MNNNISVLDCTLRDGLRIVDCAFSNNKITGLSEGLIKAGIDIIEVGFLRDKRNLDYKGDSTFFTEVQQITPLLPPKSNNQLFVAFVDYGMFDFDSLKIREKNDIDGIRVGFTKKDFSNNFDDIIRSLRLVKERGYKLFVQGVNSLGYTDSEYLRIIEAINDINPYCFSIVDTYGAMYDEDLLHYYSLVDYNLKSEIRVGFHSHNNYQLSFSLAQKFISISSKREIVIDCTLNGIGKVAGNLNTELITHFLNKKYGFDYDEDTILDLVDNYTYSLRQKFYWGYSIPSMLAGEFKSHPNNIIYLTEKFRLDTKDIKYIISMIDEQKRQRYDYDNIEKLYIEYNTSKIDDEDCINKLSETFMNSDVLIIGPGSSYNTYNDKIKEFINNNRVITISINFIPDGIYTDYAFFGSNKRLVEAKAHGDLRTKIIATSNIKFKEYIDYLINYSKVIECGFKHFDNSTIMLLNLLKRLSVKSIYIAGVDGYQKGADNYCSKELDYMRDIDKYDDLNNEIETMIRNFWYRINNKMNIEFLTPSIYSSILRNE